ncbi:MAG: hypothetical protein PHT07_24520 [Paludibacter sp.]|nr:hypothetical protein [Paludibacter sp.]
MSRLCYWHPDYIPCQPIVLASKYVEPETIVMADNSSYTVIFGNGYFLVHERDLITGDTMMQSFKSRFFAEKFIAEKIKAQKRPL